MIIVNLRLLESEIFRSCNALIFLVTAENRHNFFCHNQLKADTKVEA